MATHHFYTRIDVWKDTREKSRDMPQPPPSVKYYMQHDFDLSPTFAQTRIAVEDADTIDCALYYKAHGYNPVALNLSDDCFPGGCVDLGSGAQEESLFRRTNLCRTLLLSMYPIRDREAIYSPGVTVFKRSEQETWAPMMDTIAFISCPGIKYPKTDFDAASGAERLSPEDSQRLKDKVATILQLAHVKGHDCVILGALGCGAWKNPAPHVAEIMRQVIDEYRAKFRAVAIAVWRNAGDPRNRGIDNFDSFSNAMKW